MAGSKQPQLFLNVYSTRPQTRAYGAYGATSGLKPFPVAYQRHAFAYGNLDYATPCLAYSSGVLTDAHLIKESLKAFWLADFVFRKGCAQQGKKHRPRG